ncbi:interleukin-1 receptor-associated kinase 4 [Cololabis saira]|uniref:interleukin-1 receptor-associated kinase 4 n=1 Tax=Cololabis saira TaxID=129043 RepID=UPI002AD409F0|nr:interleukin-1 receptor-associated kinase 4 [Cololabis saira]
MASSVTSATYIRNISYGLRRKLSDFLDPQERWKEVAVNILKPSGEPRYSQHHIRRFEGLVLQGRSPTVELLNDWGTTSCTVGDLVDILKSQLLLAAASLLLPDTVEEYSSAKTREDATVKPNGPPSTRLLGDARPSPTSSTQRTEILSGNSEGGHAGFSSFSFSDLRRITGNFDDRSTSNGGSRIGEGGFGTVYKGLLNGRLVAVKKLNPIDDMPMDELQGQFNQEIQTLQVLKHDNLVDMVGFSCDEQQLCLVYAFMANGSLLDRLACLDGSPLLSWRQRCSIAEGTARGLEYLHSNHHVHRDVKSANILLDENLVPKISDFGLTRASAKGTSTTMMTERIMGTSAYMAPEALRGNITPKSDVFSFGVVLLEILSGLPPADENQEPQLLMEVRYNIDDEDEELTLQDFVDKKMRDWEMSQVESIYCLASNCLHDRRNMRPAIKQVVSEIHSVVKSIFLESQAQD